MNMTQTQKSFKGTIFKIEKKKKKNCQTFYNRKPGSPFL